MEYPLLSLFYCITAEHCCYVQSQLCTCEKGHPRTLVLQNISVWLDSLGLLHSKQLIRSIVSRLVRKATDIKNGRFLACKRTEVNMNSEDLSSGHPLTRISPLIISSKYKTGARNKEQLTWLMSLLHKCKLFQFVLHLHVFWIIKIKWKASKLERIRI